MLRYLDTQEEHQQVRVAGEEEGAREREDHQRVLLGDVLLRSIVVVHAEDEEQGGDGDHAHAEEFARSIEGEHMRVLLHIDLLIEIEKHPCTEKTDQPDRSQVLLVPKKPEVQQHHAKDGGEDQRAHLSSSR